MPSQPQPASALATASAVFALMALPAPTLAAPVVQLSALVVPFDSAIGLDVHEPSGRLMETRNYPNGSGGNLALLSPPTVGAAPLFPPQSHAATPFSALAGVPGEVNIVTVKTGHSFGAPVGTTFVADETGLVRQVSADGSSVSTLAQLPTGRGPVNLALDPGGQWGGRLVASTSAGGLFLLDAAGHIETLATGQGQLQGVNFIPDDATRWGRFAGCIMAGTEPGGSSAAALTHLWCRASDGSTHHETRQLGVQAEDIDVINGGNFYAIDYSQGRLWGGEAGAFASFQGDLLLTQERPDAGTSGLFHVGFDAASDSFTVEALDLHFNINTSGTHGWEQVVFSHIGFGNIAAVGDAELPTPSTWALSLAALLLGGAFSRRR